MNYTLLQYYYNRQQDQGFFTLTNLVLLVLGFSVYALIKGSVIKKTILSHGHKRFETPLFSPQDFYEEVSRVLKQKEMSKASTSRVSYLQGGLFSPRREYLRIAYKGFIYDICAAPFGSGFFISWWLGEMGHPFRDFLQNLPVLGKLFNKREKSFYELDTEIMFKEMATASINEAITSLSNTSGKRVDETMPWSQYLRPQ